MGTAIGHCLLLNENGKLILIDAGIGLDETSTPEKKLRRELLAISNFQFDENITAIKQIKRLGYSSDQIKHCILSHLDPDHIGGLADFPNMKIHVSKEEYDSFKSGDERYIQQQLAHNPTLELYAKNDREWFGLPARKINLEFETEFYLIPLFGHTLGHCGIAFKKNKKWMFYVGDAYLLRAEIDQLDHPVDKLATKRAVNNKLRKKSLEKIRAIVKRYGNEIDYFGYHDPLEFK